MNDYISRAAVDWKTRTIPREMLECGYMTFDKTADWVREHWKFCPICGAKNELGGT